jgi:hypothetical protein
MFVYVTDEHEHDHTQLIMSLAKSISDFSLLDHLSILEAKKNRTH